MNYTICLICLSDTNEKIPLIENDSEYIQLNDTGKMYMDCFNIKLQVLNNHPMNICNYCYCQLTVFHKFSMLAKGSFKKLFEFEDLKSDKECYLKDGLIEEINLDYSTTMKTETLLNDDLNDTIKNDILQIKNDLQSDQEYDDNEEHILDEDDSAYPVEYLDLNDELDENNLKNSDIFENDSSQDLKSIFDIGDDDKIEIIGEAIQAESEFIEIYSSNSQNESKHSTCSECNITFESIKDFRSHRKAAHPHKNYTCDDCGKKFKRADMYESHMNVHKGLPPFFCNECNKPFNFKANYRIHMLLHTNERPFTCSLCGKGFRAKWDLVMHYRVHNDVRNYECQICGKSFRVSSHLSAHMYSHSDKKFECDICYQKYNSPKSLKQHKDTIHLNKPVYECSKCNKKFRRKHHLENHMKTHKSL